MIVGTLAATARENNNGRLQTGRMWTSSTADSRNGERSTSLIDLPCSISNMQEDFFGGRMTSLKAGLLKEQNDKIDKIDKIDVGQVEIRIQERSGPLCCLQLKINWN